MKLKILPGSWRLLAIAVVYFAVISFGNLPDRLILFPTTAPLDTHGAIHKTISAKLSDAGKTEFQHVSVIPFSRSAVRKMSPCDPVIFTSSRLTA